MSQTKEMTGSAELLSALYKNAKMGSDAIISLLPHVKDERIKTEMTEELSRYEEFAVRAKKGLLALGESAEENNVITKISSKIGIELNAIKDSSDSHIAEMLIEGTTMAITDTLKLCHNFDKNDASHDALDLAGEIVRFGEDTVERLKKFL